MKEFNEMDDAFRQGLGFFESPPPPKVWDGVKGAVLSKQITVLARRVTIYKRIAASMGVLLLFGASSQVLPWDNFFSKKSAITDSQYSVQNNESIADTVYVSQTITKYDTVYVDRVKIVPQIVYINTPNDTGNFYEEKTQSTPNSNIAILENKNTGIGNVPEKTKNAQTPQKEVFSEQTNVVAETKSTVENAKPKENEFSTKIVLNELEGKEFKNTAKAPKFRKINYQIPFESIRDFYRRDTRLTVADRLSVEALLGGSQNQLILKNISQQGQFKPGYSFDARVGVILGRGWTFRTGIGYDNARYAVNTAKKQTLIAEALNGTSAFVYRTPFGNSVIANETLNFIPEVGDEIEIESENENQIGFWKIPFSLSYDFFDKDIRLFGGFRSTKLYAIAGGFLSIPTLHRAEVEIYEPDGEEFYTTLTDFKGLSNLAFGGSLGVGSKIYFGQRISLMGEASFYRNATQLVNNEFFQSVPQGGRFQLGLSYDLK